MVRTTPTRYPGKFTTAPPTALDLTLALPRPERFFTPQRGMPEPIGTYPGLSPGRSAYGLPTGLLGLQSLQDMQGLYNYNTPSLYGNQFGGNQFGGGLLDIMSLINPRYGIMGTGTRRPLY